MPGIVGLITKAPREQAERELLRMVATLDHEPFYVTGTWVDESLGVYVGWVARKDSPGETAPARNAAGQVLVFSGEEHGGLQAFHEGCGDVLSRLNGRFHGLLADPARGTAVLFNDRYGMHRLYYHAAPEGFYFAAEAKAILEARPELRRLDPRSLGEYVAAGCVMEERTLFDRVHVLPGAAAWTFRRGSLVGTGAYFRPEEWEGQATLEPEAFYRELRDVVARVVPRHFAARERVGISLTGGLDSRILMAWQKPAPGSLPCYTFGGMFRDSHDVRVARQVAAACGQPHEVIRVGHEFLSRFARYAERSVYLTDGCANVSHAADLYINERAREIAPIRMTGNYAGEVLRGIVAFGPETPSAGLFQPELTTAARAAATTFARLRQTHPVSFAVFRQAPWHHYGLLALEQSQLALRSPFLDNDLVRTVLRAPAASLASTEVCERLIADGSPALARIWTDRGPGHAQQGLRSRLARAANTFEKKAEYAFDYGMPQWLARVDHLLSPVRPERLFLGRHKFYHFRTWYRDALSGYVQEVLLDPRALSRPYLERRTVEAIVREHVRGVRNHTTEIHTLLTLELVHRLFVDR
jgi:asparagine synthase (glutamine-hydrolysing)